MTRRRTRSVTRKTVGLAEKVTWPSALLVAAGVVVLILDQLGVVDVEDEIWITMLGAGGATFGVGYSAPAPVVTGRVNGNPKEPV